MRGTSSYSGASWSRAAALPLPSQCPFYHSHRALAAMSNVGPHEWGFVDSRTSASACPSRSLVDNFAPNFNRFTSLALSPCATSLVFGAGSTRSSYQYGSDLSASRYMPSSLIATSQKLSQRICANIPPLAHFSIGRLRPGHVLSPMRPSFLQPTEPCCTLAPCKAHVSSKSKGSRTPSMPSSASSGPNLERACRTVRARR